MPLTVPVTLKLTINLTGGLSAPPFKIKKQHMALKESKDAKDFRALKKGQTEAVKGVVATAKEDMFKRGRVKHKMSMIHTTDWSPGYVTNNYRNHYDGIFRNN